MKRVKLMLLSLSILAVVGGALAFTAKNAPFYCTAPTILVEGVTTVSTFCTVRASIKPGPLGTENVATTTVPSGGCASDTPCFATNPGKTIE